MDVERGERHEPVLFATHGKDDDPFSYIYSSPSSSYASCAIINAVRDSTG